MFAPTKTWRKWHVKTNQNQKRFATASALAASALPSLVLARGHRIEQVAEIPLIVPNKTENLLRTKEAVALLESLNAYADVVKVSNSRKIRAGIGKIRNRRHRQRRGPLIVYNEDHGIVKAFRNLPGVELACVQHLNLLQLAPGGHLGRFVIWTQSAFAALDTIYGTYGECSSIKKDYSLPQSILSNSDVSRLINSDEVQSVVRTAGPKRQPRPFTQKKNPLKNNGIMIRLNPYAIVVKRAELKRQASQAKTKGAKVEKRKKKKPDRKSRANAKKLLLAD
jgi:large subunit ribosomal protein L4e